jgi:hypothetical protein
MSNLKYKSKELIPSLLISKYSFVSYQNLIKNNKLSILINIKEINKLYSVIIYIVLLFFCYKSKPLFLNKNYRFFRRQSFFKKNNHLSFFLKLNLHKNDFFDFLQFFFLFSTHGAVLDVKNIKNNTISLSDFSFLRNILRMFLKLDNDIFVYLLKIDFLISINFNLTLSSHIKLFYLKLLGFK